MSRDTRRSVDLGSTEGCDAWLSGLPMLQKVSIQVHNIMDYSLCHPVDQAAVRHTWAHIEPDEAEEVPSRNFARHFVCSDQPDSLHQGIYGTVE